MKKYPPQQPQWARHPGGTSREAASWHHFTAAHKTFLARKELCVISDLGYCASGSVFRKIVVYLCHRSFYCIHHLKDKNRNNSGDCFPEAFRGDRHLKSTSHKAAGVLNRGLLCPSQDIWHLWWLWRRGGGGGTASTGWMPRMTKHLAGHSTAPTTKTSPAQDVTSAEAEKPA